ncbi:MAG: peptide deformylase [Microscillaceae bacterium]
MIYPIVAYGDPVLRQKTRDIDPADPQLDLKKLVADMYETMYAANGVGLAAPQIGLPLRLFVIDSTRMSDDGLGLRRAFVNARLLSESGEAWPYEEGCLSIPNIREDVSRRPLIKLHSFDEDWQEYEEEFDEMTARVIQHEYDHIEGILFTDHISPFKKTLLKSKLTKISKGKVKVDYRMRFPA